MRSGTALFTFVLQQELKDVDSGSRAPGIEHDAVLVAAPGI